jgi:hypothetical protein
MRPAILLATLTIGLACAPRIHAQDWRPLFNGRDTSGWQQVGRGSFTVENGALVTHGGMGLLWYAGEKFGNCTIRIVYRKGAGEHGNSGVFVRIPEPPPDAWYAVHHGYEVQINDHEDEFHRTGSIYSMSRADTFPPSPDGWNTLEITLDGSKTIIHVNGALVNEFDPATASIPERRYSYEPERGPRPNEGYIGLQNHDDRSILLFREVSVRPFTR